jgi:hypothetical protein
MPTVTAVSRQFTRPRHGRLPRATSTPWLDTRLSVEPRTGGWWVPNHDTMPDGVPETQRSDAGAELVAGFWTANNGTWASEPEEIRPDVPASHAYPVLDNGADAFATAWYFDLGGGDGNGGPGVSIDQLAEIQGGILLDDPDFASVAGDAALTVAANQDGWVPTDVACVVTAVTTSEGFDFDSWMYAGSGIVADGVSLRLGAGANGWALAVYEDRTTWKLPPGYLLRPQLVFDEAAVLLQLASGPSSDPARTTLSRVAAAQLIATLAPLLGPDHGADIAKLATADRHEAGAAL